MLTLGSSESSGDSDIDDEDLETKQIGINISIKFTYSRKYLNENYTVVNNFRFKTLTNCLSIIRKTFTGLF